MLLLPMLLLLHLRLLRRRLRKSADCRYALLPRPSSCEGGRRKRVGRYRKHLAAISLQKKRTSAQDQAQLQHPSRLEGVGELGGSAPDQLGGAPFQHGLGARAGAAAAANRHLEHAARQRANRLRLKQHL